MRNLQGTRITVKRDLNQQRQENRKAMISLRKALREAGNDKLGTIRNDEMRMENGLSGARIKFLCIKKKKMV